MPEWALYDAMATMSRRTGGAPHARYLGRAAVRREAPGLDAATVIAGLQYPDGRMDDARHTLAVARTAAGYGARVITRAPVVAINRDGSGRVVGVRIRDELTDAEADNRGPRGGQRRRRLGGPRAASRRCHENRPRSCSAVRRADHSHTLRMRTQFTAWFSPLRRIAGARPRVGLMFSSRFGPLMASQKVPAVLSASASDISA